MKGVRQRLVIAAVLATTFLVSGCDSEIASRYTPKNMLIGAAIGVCVGLFLTVLGSLSKKEDKNKQEDEDNEDSERDT